MQLPKYFLRWGLLLALVTAVSVFGVVLYVIAVTDHFIYLSATEVPKEEVALVLGASIKSSGELSPVLRERADAAAALYKAHTVEKILVSGDNSSLDHNEVYPVGKYLLAQGVPQSDIFLDYAGFDTYSSMYRARDVFGVSSVVVVSQRFHLPRALFIAHALGMSAVGLDAGAPHEYYIENAAREIPATVKAIYDLFVHRKPQYLGERFSVFGDGSATWVGLSSSSAQMLYFRGD